MLSHYVKSLCQALFPSLFGKVAKRLPSLYPASPSILPCPLSSLSPDHNPSHSVAIIPVLDKQTSLCYNEGVNAGRMPKERR